MTKSLQQIEDYYLSQGLNGEDLRKALENDPEFQKMLPMQVRIFKFIGDLFK